MVSLWKLWWGQYMLNVGAPCAPALPVGLFWALSLELFRGAGCRFQGRFMNLAQSFSSLIFTQQALGVPIGHVSMEDSIFRMNMKFDGGPRGKHQLYSLPLWTQTCCPNALQPPCPNVEKPGLQHRPRQNVAWPDRAVWGVVIENTTLKVSGCVS